MTTDARPEGKGRNRILPTALMVVLAIVFMVPLYWLLMSSFRPSERIFADAGDFIPDALTLDNFKRLFADAPFVTWFTNSFDPAHLVGATIGSLVVITMAAYPLARLHFRGRNVLFVSILASYMLPFHLLLIPFVC